jgi:hypothetical protein
MHGDEVQVMGADDSERPEPISRERPLLSAPF